MIAHAPRSTPQVSNVPEGISLSEARLGVQVHDGAKPTERGGRVQCEFPKFSSAPL